MQDHKPFAGSAAHSYAAGPPRQVPGFESLHRMTGMLLAERVPADGRILVLGAGGGLELKALADAHPGWTFDGVDPSADMLQAAADLTAYHASRIRLHEGSIGDAPPGPFDGAVSLLTFHFIPHDQRVATLRGLHDRLTPGAPLILAHISIPAGEPARSRGIARHVAWGAGPGADPARLAASRDAIASRLTILSPDEEEAHLAEARFTDIELFYAGLSFRGWVAYRAG